MGHGHNDREQHHHPRGPRCVVRRVASFSIMVTSPRETNGENRSFTSPIRMVTNRASLGRWGSIELIEPKAGERLGSALALSRAVLPAADFQSTQEPDVDNLRKFQPRRRSVAQGRAMSNDFTFSPPAISGLDGSTCSRSSRLRTSARATTKASFTLLACRSATLKKASPK